MKTPQNPIRSQIVHRSKLIFGVMLLLVAVIIVQLIRLQTVKKIPLLEQVKDIKEIQEVIPADRGNIFAADGKSLLATTIPVYTVAIDPTICAEKWTVKSGSKKDTVYFNKSVDSLAFLLAKHFGEYTKAEYVQTIMAARATRKRKDAKEHVQYVQLIKKPVGVEARNLIATFPIFRRGGKGGAILKENAVREYPFGQMAKRSVGKVDSKTRKGIFGIERSFNDALAGRDGFGTYNKISGNNLQAVEASDDTQPETGQDVITTIDVNLQDMAESALLDRLYKTNARYGTVVVMEIKTGEIKAIANYGRQINQGNIFYADDKNYAVQEGTDPGSTFKLASMIALLEKAKLNPDDFAAECKGGIAHGKEYLKCSHAHGIVNVKQAMEESCNVGIYQLVKKYFGFGRTSSYFDYIKPLKLHQRIDFQLIGETKPLMTFSSDKQNFSNTTIPWTSIGYELRLTPLQMLTFYNAVANDGYWVEPLIVKEIRKANEVTKTFNARKMPEPFCSQRTIGIVKEMLKGVVLQGTAKNIKDGFCTIAGKTGTAQKKSATKEYKEGTEVYTSFIGYFPAENPKYSCVVAIDAPEGGSLYGNTIAAPVFREIANKVFAYDIAIHPAKKVKVNVNLMAQKFTAGKASDFVTIAEGLGLSSKPDEKMNWVAAQSSSPTSIQWQQLSREEHTPPDVRGMVLRDALFLLENSGYDVRYAGKGKVKSMEKQDEKNVLLVLN